MKKFKSYIVTESANGPYVICKLEGRQVGAEFKLNQLSMYGEFDTAQQASEWATDNIDMEREGVGSTAQIKADSLVNCETMARESGITPNKSWNPINKSVTNRGTSTFSRRESFNPFFYSTSKSALHHYYDELNKSDEKEDISEAVRRSRALNSAAIVERATSVCLEAWYSLTKTFNGHPEKYDPHPVDPSDDYMHFKLSPTMDYRDDAYDKIISECDKIADKLNDALGRRLFEPEILRKDGMLEVRTVYIEGSGGIFRGQTKNGEVGVIIELVMPKQKKLREAFSNLVMTPSMPLVDDSPEASPATGDAPMPEDNVDMEQGADTMARESRDFFENFYIGLNENKALIGSEFELGGVGPAELVHIISTDQSTSSFNEDELQRLRALKAEKEAIRDDPETERIVKRIAAADIDVINAKIAELESKGGTNTKTIDGYFRAGNDYYRATANVETMSAPTARTVSPMEVEEAIASSTVTDSDIEKAKTKGGKVADQKKRDEQTVQEKRAQLERRVVKARKVLENLVREEEVIEEELRSQRAGAGVSAKRSRNRDKIGFMKRRLDAIRRAKGAMDNLIASLQKFITDVIDNASRFAQNTLRAIGEFMNKTNAFLDKFFDMLLSKYKNLTINITTWMSRVINMVGKGMGYIVNGVRDITGGVINLPIQVFRAAAALVNWASKSVTKAVDKLESKMAVESAEAIDAFFITECKELDEFIKNKKYLYDNDNMLSEGVDWEGAAIQRERGEYPMYRTRIDKIREELAANSVGGGGVDFAPDAGNKKKPAHMGPYKHIKRKLRRHIDPDINGPEKNPPYRVKEENMSFSSGPFTKRHSAKDTD